ncbi:hypothetical protein KEJ21_06965, partial [Candidatus Bathyarchaeota archaeon]|nr:hypothetical protein [Candidatus Bathyarchaeota archaeon]
MSKMRARKATKEAHAYTPGLKVKRSIKVLKTRTLPIPGEVVVEKGNSVEYDTIVARATAPGNPTIIKASDLLNILPENLPPFILKKEGEQVKKGEIIAKYTPFWGLIKRFVYSPVDGIIESISDETGQIIVREPPIPVEINAYIPGNVVEVLPSRGVIIETNAAYIQGIFGVGGERHGKLIVAADSNDDILTEKEVPPDYKGKIIVGGSLVTFEALKRAEEIGVKGIIVGGVQGVDINNFLGYEIGVAITGHEDINTTIIVTEGFGKMSMSKSVYDLLKEFEGYEVSINGTTQ